LPSSALPVKMKVCDSKCAATACTSGIWSKRKSRAALDLLALNLRATSLPKPMNSVGHTRGFCDAGSSKKVRKVFAIS
jgi:hypothetical protein